MSPVEPDVERLVRTALSDVARASDPAPDLTARLIANTAEGRTVVSPLRRPHRGPWLLPLLAAVLVLGMTGGVLALRAALDHHGRAPAARTGVPTPQPHHGTHSPSPSHPTGSPTVPTRKDFTAADVAFTDPSTGWALGDGPCRGSARTNCPQLLATTDGQNWHALHVPHGLVSTRNSASCGTNGTIQGPCVDHVLFADRSDGYLWSLHEFYWTADGGRQWHREPHAPAHTGATELVLAGNTVLRMRPIADCSAGCRGVLQAAQVGTGTWHSVTPAPAGLFTSQLQVAGGAVYFLAGDDATHAGSGIYRTTDGGAHWQHVAARPCGAGSSGAGSEPSSRIAAIAAGPDGTLAAQCERGRGTVRVAPAGSTTFGADQPLPGSNRETPYLWGATSAQRLDDFNYLNGERLQLWSSADGGATWTKGPVVAASVMTPQLVASSVGGTSAFGYVASRSHVWVTADGGQTWTEKGY